MTVTTTANSISYAANGTTTAFAFPFIFFAATDLVVTLLDATGLPVVRPVLNGAGTYDYAVTGTVTHGEYASGGTVTFNTAPLAGWTVSLVRSVPAIQTVTLIDNTKFPADTVNVEFDYLTVLAQQSAALAGGLGSTALQIPQSEAGLTVVAVPAAARASKLLLWDGAGNLSTLDPASIIGGSVPSGPAGGDLAGTYPNPIVRLDGFLYGLKLSNSSTTGITVGPGNAADQNNATMMRNTAPLTKLIASGWVAGTGNGGLGNTVSRTASTWYHMFGGLAGGTFDMFYDTSPTGANKPAAFASIRRLGSILTGTGATPPILAFVQDGDWFGWGVWVLDLNIASTTVAATNRALRVPPGIVTMSRAVWSLSSNNVTTYSAGYIYDPAITPPTVGVNSQLFSLYASGNAGTTNAQIDCRTNTLSQVGTIILSHAGSDVSWQATTVGWTDTRGRLG